MCPQKQTNKKQTSDPSELWDGSGIGGTEPAEGTGMR